MKVARCKDEYLSCFANLGTSISPSQELISQLTCYVCHLYGYENQSDVNLVRYLAFKDGKYEEEMLPPNEDSLLQHIRRAVYQCYIWRNATQPILNLPNFTEHGWSIDDNGKVCVKWMNLPPAPDSILTLVNCKCTKGCSNNRCSCRKSKLTCTDVCKCNDCQNGKTNNEEDDDDDVFDHSDCLSDSDNESDE